VQCNEHREPVQFEQWVGGSATWFQVSPTLPVAGGRYNLYVTVGASSAGSVVISTITGTGWTGLPPTTDVFNNTVLTSGDSWARSQTIRE